MVPTRWVDVDKAEARRETAGKCITPASISRLVARGDLEGLKERTRTVSLTCELAAIRLTIAYAVGRRLKIRSADISNAYFQGDPMDRLLLLKPPPGGLPWKSSETGEYGIVARVPSYGTSDAGRNMWNGLRSERINAGMR